MCEGYKTGRTIYHPYPNRLESLTVGICLYKGDFSRPTLDLQGPPTRNIISQTVQKCTFPVYANKTLRFELFASPTSLHFSVHLSLIDS